MATGSDQCFHANCGTIQCVVQRDKQRQVIELMGDYATDGFVFFSSYYEAVRPIPNEERLAVLDAILDYVFLGREPDLSPILMGYFALIRPILDKSMKRRAASVENGKLGGRPSKDARKGTKKNPSIAEEKPTRNLSKTGNGEDKERKGLNVDLDVAAVTPPRTPRFTPPSVDEVSAYCAERGNRVDAQAFVDFYESKGWKIGNSPMRSWQAAVRNWERRERERFTCKQQSGNVFLELAREEGLT